MDEKTFNIDGPNARINIGGVDNSTNIVAAPYTPRERVEKLAQEFAESLVKTVITQKPGFYAVDFVVEAFGTNAALHFDISTLEASQSNFNSHKRLILETLHAHWKKLPEQSRFAMEGEHHLFDKTGACYWIRERDAIEKMNAKLELIASQLQCSRTLLEVSDVAANVRRMKERI